MKNKIGIIILACVLVVSFVLGVTGAVTFAKDESTDNADGASKDRLIGVFITTEYLDLFDFESYFQDNADKVLSGGEISSSDSAPYEGKLYAILVDDPYGVVSITSVIRTEVMSGYCVILATQNIFLNTIQTLLDENEVSVIGLWLGCRPMYPRAMIVVERLSAEIMSTCL